MNYFNKFLLAICCCLVNAKIFSIVDLYKNRNDFIVETKQINIPNFPCSFNPSITKWKNNSFLMSFRIRDKDQSTNKIGLIELNNHLEINGKVFILDIKLSKPLTYYMYQENGPQEQDPRLLKICDRIYIIYSHYQVGKMFIGEILFDGKNFCIKDPECLINFEAETIKREKNWVPFEYKNDLFLAYSISPHKILQPKYGTCANFAITDVNIIWNYGEIRGGTPALKVDNKYLAFFHTSKNLKTLQSNGHEIAHYFIGAYTFSLNPPFNLTHISKDPIIANDFYTSPDYKTWKPLKVVFPGGFIFDENYIWLFFGKQDFEIWYVKLNKKKLFDSLIPLI